MGIQKKSAKKGAPKAKVTKKAASKNGAKKTPAKNGSTKSGSLSSLIKNHVFADGRDCYNFSAGPCVLPKAVLDQCAAEMYSYKGTGQSALELSHRCDEFREMSVTTKNEIRKFLKVPKNYKIMLQQGGATLQYTAIVKNLIGLKPHKIANLMVTGLWSKQNAAEMAKHGKVNMVADNLTDNTCTKMVDPKKWKIDPKGSFFYFCANETVHGFEIDFKTFPWQLIPKDMPVVVDMSSNIGTTPIPWDKMGVVFFGAQKNFGPSGCAIIIVREDLFGHAQPDIPVMCDWLTFENATDTYYNTPAVYPLYVTGLNAAHMNKMGGIPHYNKLANQRSKLLWSCVDGSNGYYQTQIKDTKYRSRCNVIFRIGNGNVELEQKFIAEGSKVGIKQIKAHPVNPGIRISMYNALPVEGVVHLTNFMKDFKNRYPLK